VRQGAPAPAGTPPSRHPPYITPQVTREWPPDEPTDPVDWPLAILMALALLATFVVVHAALHPHVPTGPAIASLAALMLVIGLSEQAYDRLLPPEARALRRARKALLLGEEPHVTAGRVRGLRLRGRAASCRDKATRCLVEAGRMGRMEERLRREAARWLARALDETFKDVS
jgi:hypothetical protein